MCGKKVHCFGMPFYGGWGVTEDRVTCSRRVRKRSIEEIFHFAYIVYSRYMNPETGQRCEIEEAIDYLVRRRDEAYEWVRIKRYYKMRMSVRLGICIRVIFYGSQWVSER